MCAIGEREPKVFAIEAAGASRQEGQSGYVRPQIAACIVCS